MHRLFLLFIAWFFVFQIFGQLSLIEKNERYPIAQNVNWIPDVIGNLLFFSENEFYKAKKGQLPEFSQSIRSTGEITQLLPINAFKTILFSADQQQICFLDNTFGSNGNCIDLEDYDIQNAKICAISARPNLIYVYDELNSSLYLIDLVKKKTIQSVINMQALIGRSIDVKSLKEHNNALFLLNNDSSIFVFDMFLSLKGQLEKKYKALNFWNGYVIQLDKGKINFHSLENKQITLVVDCPLSDRLSVHGNSFYFSTDGVISRYELKSQ